LNASHAILKEERGVTVTGNSLVGKFTGDYRLGLHAGCFMNKNLNSRISYTSELLFTQKGFINPSDGGSLYSTWEWQSDNSNNYGYLASSNYLNYSVGVLNLFAGIEVSSLLYARYVEGNGNTVIINGEWPYDYSKFDFSSIGGVCINTKSNLAFSIRYINSFVSFTQNKIFFTDEVGTIIREDKPRQLNRTWSLSVLYYL